MKKTLDKKKIKREMTIDDLAVVVTKGFREVNKKIAHGAENTESLARMVAKGFESVDKKFEAMDKKFSDKFEEVTGEFKEVDSRFDRLEAVVCKIDGKVDSIDKRLKKVDDAIEPLVMGYSITRREIQELIPSPINLFVFR